MLESKTLFPNSIKSRHTIISLINMIPKNKKEQTIFNLRNASLKTNEITEEKHSCLDKNTTPRN